MKATSAVSAFGTPASMPGARFGSAPDAGRRSESHTCARVLRLLFALAALLVPIASLAQRGALPLSAGQVLQRDLPYASPSGRHFLIFQGDGNLVVARSADKAFLWGLNTVPGVDFRRSAKVRLEPSGHLVVYDGTDQVLWQVPTGAARPGSVLNLDGEGTLRIVAPDGSSAWSSADAAGQVVEKPLSGIRSGDSLARNVRYVSESGKHYLVFLGDGNLVVARKADDGYVWGTNAILGDFFATTSVRFRDGELSVWNENINQSKRAGDAMDYPRRWWTPAPSADQRAGARLTITPAGVLQIVSGPNLIFSVDGQAASAGATPAAPASAAGQGSVAPSSAAALNDEQRSILDTHNRLRALHGVPALQWSPVLAAEAQRFADACVQEHGTYESRNGAGENLSAYNDETMADRVESGWYAEERQYDYDNPGFNKRGSSQETQTGHFTQVVWAATTDLGCARANCPGYPWKGFLVCRYLPAGNSADPGPNGEASAFRRNVPPKQ